MVKEATKEKKQEGQLAEGKITWFRPFEPGVYLEVKKEPKEGQLEMRFSGKSACGEEIEVRAELQITEDKTEKEEGGDKIEIKRSISLRGDAPIKWEAWGGWELSDNKVSITDAFLNFCGEDVFSYKGGLGDTSAVRMKFKGQIDCDLHYCLTLKELSLYTPNDMITPDIMAKSYKRIVDAAKEVVAFSTKVEELLNSEEGLKKMRRLELPPKPESGIKLKLNKSSVNFHACPKQRIGKNAGTYVDRQIHMDFEGVEGCKLNGRIYYSETMGGMGGDRIERFAELFAKRGGKGEWKDTQKGYPFYGVSIGLSDDISFTRTLEAEGDWHSGAGKDSYLHFKLRLNRDTNEVVWTISPGRNVGESLARYETELKRDANFLREIASLADQFEEIVKTDEAVLRELKKLKFHSAAGKEE